MCDAFRFPAVMHWSVQVFSTIFIIFCKNFFQELFLALLRATAQQSWQQLVSWRTGVRPSGEPLFLETVKGINANLG